MHPLTLLNQADAKVCQHPWFVSTQAYRISLLVPVRAVVKLRSAIAFGHVLSRVSVHAFLLCYDVRQPDVFVFLNLFA